MIHDTSKTQPLLLATRQNVLPDPCSEPALPFTGQNVFQPCFPQGIQHLAIFTFLGHILIWVAHLTSQAASRQVGVLRCSEEHGRRQANHARRTPSWHITWQLHATTIPRRGGQAQQDACKQRLPTRAGACDHQWGAIVNVERDPSCKASARFTASAAAHRHEVEPLDFDLCASIDERITLPLLRFRPGRGMRIDGVKRCHKLQHPVQASIKLLQLRPTVHKLLHQALGHVNAALVEVCRAHHVGRAHIASQVVVHDEVPHQGSPSPLGCLIW
mmetsp:Transcript_54347/g.158654  ORF Transcript_54347/g.158654 Transcript_54347/m.158654 type:complete len:273 (-) Transcript_54347:2406-3224(-)